MRLFTLIAFLASVASAESVPACDDCCAALTSSMGFSTCPIPLSSALTSGLHAHFRSSQASTTWTSTVGSFVSAVTAGTVTGVEEAAGNGALKVVKALKGTPASQFAFGGSSWPAILPATWSACVVSRYAGTTRKRIIIGSSSSNDNFLLGH